MDTVISIKGIGKQYKIYHRQKGYVALREVISNILFRPLKYAKTKAKRVLGKETKEEFWALKDINLEIGRGEIIGIIGKNGAGKSTLLKILTGITPPTEGEIKLKGRVASLLEVGTGFHPELTGRENIFLNGAILGMTKKEILKKFDDIVEFSGIEKFLDTPVKRYSSGMYVRLAFSVAAHLEPDILLVDEVLAVGDAEFQKKCLGKMDEVTKQAGRTILFVSHNMDAISRLCKKTILLDQGKIIASGDTNEVVEKYLKGGCQEDTELKLPLQDREITLRGFSITQNESQNKSMNGGQPIAIDLDFEISKKLQSFRTGILIKNSSGILLSRSYAQDYAPELEEIEPGRYKTRLIIPERLLMAGEYQIEAKMFCLGISDYLSNVKIQKTITVHNPTEFNEIRSKSGVKGYFLVPNVWNVKHSKI